MSFPEPPQSIQNTVFILCARIKANPGKGAEVKKLLGAVRDRAVSDNEPGTLTYRTSVSTESEDLLNVYEEYKGKKALDEHRAAEPFQALGKSGLVADLNITYWTEF